MDFLSGTCCYLPAHFWSAKIASTALALCKKIQSKLLPFSLTFHFDGGGQNDDEVPATRGRGPLPRTWNLLATPRFFFFSFFRHFCFYRVPKAAQEFLSLPQIARKKCQADRKLCKVS